MRVGECFSGIGGFGLALSQVGAEIAWAYENAPPAIEIYQRHFPGVPIYPDIRRHTEDVLSPVDLICGGDPCPSRSLAKGNRKSSHPDLAGYFLALVGRLQPRWLVRENVRSPDVVHFCAALEMLGYGVVVVELDSRDFTAQSRRRQICIGCPTTLRSRFTRTVLEKSVTVGFSTSLHEKTPTLAACLTANPCRMAAEDSYCYEPGRGLRVLSCEEREALQGFPRSWTAGLSRTSRCILLGNAVTVPAVRWLAECIITADSKENSWAPLGSQRNTSQGDVA